MTRSQGLISFFALLSSSAIPQPLAGQLPGGSGLEERIDSLMAAYGRADSRGVAAFYSPDGAVLTGGQLLTGDEIAAALDLHFARLAAQRFDFQLIDTRPIADGHAITSAVGTTQGTNAAGVPIFAGAVSVSIHWMLREGQWWIVYAQEDFKAR